MIREKVDGVSSISDTELVRYFQSRFPHEKLKQLASKESVDIVNSDRPEDIDMLTEAITLAFMKKIKASSTFPDK
jgi:pyridoxine/pyridoxamine 5'-phosphate oxidase